MTMELSKIQSIIFIFFLLISLVDGRQLTQDNDKLPLPPSPTTQAPVNVPDDGGGETTTTEKLPEPTTDSTESSTTTTTTTPTTTTTSTTAPVVTTDECDNLCLNGGQCVVRADGQMVCICPEGFYGMRCQFKDICNTIVADGLKGKQVCELIGRSCLLDDKLFRCQCDRNEYFVFKTDYFRSPGGPTNEATGRGPQAKSQFAYDSLLTGSGGGAGSAKTKQQTRKAQSSGRTPPTYLAECRKIDKCLGVRCRQTSEFCRDGRCECNQNLGYTRDSSDGLCKLLDPCQQVNSPDGRPVCGQAKCVATYDRDLYKCVCPIGYNPVIVGELRSSIQCALLTNLICDIPLLNKCQHLCKIDRRANTYKCSCLPGYKAGSRPGIDDYMCFFDEHLASHDDDDEGKSETAGNDAGRASRRVLEELKGAGRDSYITYSPVSPASAERKHQVRFKLVESRETGSEDNLGRWRNLMIKREVVYEKSVVHGTTGRSANSNEDDNNDDDHDDHDNVGFQDSYTGGSQDLSTMSAQDRCNMYCEENKICVLEHGTRDSYRCVCDRQGYVSVGDKCLDWCSAAEFSHGVQSLVAEVCYSGVCRKLAGGKRSASATSFVAASGESEGESLLAVSRSSWRPEFECDCGSSSQLMFQDPKTRLCQLDFEAILRPCLPGNEGYQDCVINKHSYCSVLHRPTHVFFRDLLAERIFENQLKRSGGSGSGNNDTNESKSSTNSERKKVMPKDKLYTCVCSPEKKFLVDKPRNKARCIDECDLLNNECGRFNRMCRAATIESSADFGFNGNLVRYDRDGMRMNQFKRTGCECLPGFNVGPTEARDFTLDDNYDPDGGTASSSSTTSNQANTPLSIYGETTSTTSGWQVLDALEIFQDGTGSGELALAEGAAFGPELEHLRTRYININSRCLLDYDVVEFHATFKAPADFEPAWIKVRNTRPLVTSSDGTTTLLPVVESEPEVAGNDSSSSARDAPNRKRRKRRHILRVPAFMRVDIAEFFRHVVLVAQCDYSLAQLSLDAYRKCLRYRYWVVQKLRRHFVDWRRVMTRQLKETFELMEGNIRFRVNKCEATIRRISTVKRAFADSMEPAIRAHDDGGSPPEEGATSGGGEDELEFEEEDQLKEESIAQEFDPLDQFAKIDADIECELTIHSASDDATSEPAAAAAAAGRRHARKVLLEKQLPKLIFSEPELQFDGAFLKLFGESLPQEDQSSLASAAYAPAPATTTPAPYYLLAPNTLIQRESFDQLARHRKLFSPCKSDYAYCDKQTRCEMVDTVNYSCTCEYGYTPIGSRDIYAGDSRKEVCEDINECLFDVCKENGLENKSVCVNEIGDYKCQCTRHHVGDNKRYCNHICNVIACKFGDCRIPDEHHAFCECHEGYREADCSVQDPSVALRKANMIICGSILTSVLLLAITLAISLNSQLKKTKKKLKRLESSQEAMEFFEYSQQAPPLAPFGAASRKRVSKASIAS